MRLLLPGLILACLALCGADWRPLPASEWRGVGDRSFPTNYWEVRDDCLVARRALTGQDLISRGEYEDFEFTFEWRVTPGANSGVKYLVDESLPHPYRRHVWIVLLACLGLVLAVMVLFHRRHKVVLASAILAAGLGLAAGEVFRRLGRMSTGLEMQILDDAGHPNGRNPLTRAGALYGRIAPSASPSRLPGEWNSGRIVVDGNRAEHWINGVRVVAYELDGKPGRRIVLQHHRDEVWYRNLRIRNAR